MCVVVPLLAVSCTSRVEKRCGICWLACCGLNITGVWTEMVKFICSNMALAETSFFYTNLRLLYAG